ncbi:hypothetical protein TWF281_005491 [Arthrobotrys megalospora]
MSTCGDTIEYDVAKVTQSFRTFITSRVKSGCVAGSLSVEIGSGIVGANPAGNRMCEGAGQIVGDTDPRASGPKVIGGMTSSCLAHCFLMEMPDDLFLQCFADVSRLGACSGLRRSFA